MQFKKCHSLIAIIALLFMVCFCAKGEYELKIEISPSEKSLIDLASKVYGEQQLMELAKSQGSLNELNTIYPIECLREDHGVYRASYLGDGSIAVILFDLSGNKLLGKTYSTPLTKSDYDGLTRGQSIREVKAIDPNGEYLFLYTGRNDTPRESSHYTKDGYLITIEYDDSNTIISINEKLI